ncbi:unnamed protein product [Eruca vesicaria subsp. sativa]|uniref:Serine carboxypeptidase n=1 Tax=Eruca vesicaria subsp. sativa TaxID=29727 RepID=A0ABC8J9M8_ERUVS|nr:unnamed protein product [Eruca vesicaria subsp. sativa]
MKLDGYNGTLPALVSTTYSWTKISSIIFLDQPVGTGFSYSRTHLGNKPSDSGEPKRIHEFLQKWLGKHQEFSSNPFYVGGDSYAGMIVPALVQEISKGNYECCSPPINLQGYMLGNPVTEPKTDYNYRIPYAHGMALISDELYESLKRVCKEEYTNVDPRNTECLKLLEEYKKTYRFVLSTYWANDKTVRKALQINEGSIGEWVRCYRDIPYNHDIVSSVPYHKNNSINGYRSLIFSGDHDMSVPYLGTQAWIRSLNYSIIDDWRPWMINHQIAGYTRTYENKMTFATIKASLSSSFSFQTLTILLGALLSCELMAKDFVSSSVLKSLLLFLQLVFLIHSADSASIIKFLPGFEGPLPFELETGYIGVGEKEEVQLFYYFIKSERNPKEDPLLLWLSGGPGCSSISGLLFENGPLTMKLDVYHGTLPSLVSTTYSWTKNSSIIFLDQPVGTGFSYSRTNLGNIPSDSGEAKRIHEFLQKWLGKHQEFSSNPFYVAGDSYSGMVVPALVQEISKGNYQCCNPSINLQGYVLGNPVTDGNGVNYRIPYAYGMALISDELYESLKRVCKGEYVNVDLSNTECLKLVEEYNKCTNRIFPYSIHYPWCKTQNPNCYMYRYVLSTYWANDKTVRKALQISEESIGEWIRCNLDIPYDHDIVSSVPYHKNNSISGYPSLIFSGDDDMGVPYLGTQAWIRSLNYSIVDDWRPWMINDQIAGYTRTYSNKMTFATIKGGGHTPEFKPEESFVMFQRWINGHPL